MSSIKLNSQSWRLLLLLFSMIMIWGLSWPMMKIGLQDSTPLWFASFRTLSGTVGIFLFFAFTKKLFWPTRAEIKPILLLGLLQLGFFVALISIGLQQVDPGRSAILVYTTPMWVTPFAVLMFGEYLSWRKAVGVLFGILGIMLLFSPQSLDWHNRQLLWGNAELLAAAASWSAAILYLRFGRFTRPPAQLMPYQMVVASIFLFVLAFLFEPEMAFHATIRLIGLSVYLGLFATAFCFAGAMVLSQRLPAVTMSLCFLAVPMIGLLSSAWIFHTAISVNTWEAIALMISGLVLLSTS